jgi:TolB-like protein
MSTLVCRRLLLLSAACSVSAHAQSPDDAQARLQRALAANPASVVANRSLGIWYYKAGRYGEARVPLDQARKLDATDGVSALYAGLAAEQMKDFPAASDAYTAYLAVGKTESVKREIRGRLIVVAGEQARAAARDAIAHESEIARVPGSATTVAVLPFRFSGADSSLRPLERGLADLLITDLARSRKLTLVERDRIQSIADEIALGRSGGADVENAVRAGRLIQAGRVVQGSLVQTGGTRVTMNSAVLDTRTSAAVGQSTPLNGVLDELFNMEKTIVLRVYADLGVELTPAERQDIDRRPTPSLQAFLSFSRGLVAEDSGRMDEAARFFENARTLDPGFGAAVLRAQAAASSISRLERGIRNSTEGSMISGAERGAPQANAGLSTTLGTVAVDVNPTTATTLVTATTTDTRPPTQRDGPAEKSGTDQPAPRVGHVTVVLKRP